MRLVESEFTYAWLKSMLVHLPTAEPPRTNLKVQQNKIPQSFQSDSTGWMLPSYFSLSLDQRLQTDRPAKSDPQKSFLGPTMNCIIGAPMHEACTPWLTTVSTTPYHPNSDAEHWLPFITEFHGSLYLLPLSMNFQSLILHEQLYSSLTG